MTFTSVLTEFDLGKFLTIVPECIKSAQKGPNGANYCLEY